MTLAVAAEAIGVRVEDLEREIRGGRLATTPGKDGAPQVSIPDLELLRADLELRETRRRTGRRDLW